MSAGLFERMTFRSFYIILTQAVKMLKLIVKSDLKKKTLVLGTFPNELFQKQLY